MVQVVKITIAVLAMACIYGSAMSQAYNCLTAPSLQINATSMAGIWYESARSPAPTDALSCARVTIGSPDSQTLSALIQYSNVAGSPDINVEDTLNVSLVDFGVTTGYNVSTSATSSVVYKILLQDPAYYVLGCGYTNASDASTIFGVILTRQESYDTTGVESVAALMYGLPQQSWSNVNQTACVLPATTPNPETTTSSSDVSGTTSKEVCTVVCTKY